MARRLIGLDIGTNAVTIAEVTPGTPPRLDMFAQVALPREAMREGEIADEHAVTEAVARLRSEVGLKKASVRIGIASPRLIVRQVEMPVMTRAELQSALHYQAADLIPIAIDEAVLDFAILGTNEANGHGEESSEPTMQVLLAAAQEATVLRLVSAVEAGGLQVAAVDLIPLALTRALARPVAATASIRGNDDSGGVAVLDDVGAEGIVSFGGGVTAIAVHENGVPRFVRVLGSGGRELTDAIAHDLDVPAETAEALKRALGGPQDDEMVARARAAMDRPLSILLDEVRSSIDYYRNQPGAARLTRVVATGGSAQMPGLPERLAALVGVPVDPAYMHDLIRIGDIGFAPDELPRLEPYLPAAVGLALGGAGIGTVVDLQPRTRRTTTRARPTLSPKVAAGIAAAVVVFGGGTYYARSQASSAKAKQAKVETEEKKLRNTLGHLEQSSVQTGQSANLGQQAASLLGTDVGWTDIVHNVGDALPAGVWLTSLQGQHTLALPVAATPRGPTSGSGSSSSSSSGSSASSSSSSASSSSSSKTASSSPTAGGTSGSSAPSGLPPVGSHCGLFQGALTGPVTMQGIAKDMPSLAQFLDNLQNAGGAATPDLTTVWLAGATKGKFGNADVITFTVNANLGQGARSDRLQHYFKGALCK